MFEALRKMIVPIIIVVLVFFTGLIILEWGSGLSSRQQFSDASVAAVINGEEVSWTEYNQLYNSLYQAEQAQVQDELSDAKIQEIQQNAWTQLLHEKLLAQQVAKQGVIVTDDELYAYLRLSPPVDLQQASFFQTDGQFDYQKYLSTMADPQAASFWRQLEPGFRAEIARLKVQESVVQTITLTEAEIREAYLLTNEKVQVGLVNFPFSQQRSTLAQPTEEELTEYYNQHKEEYYANKRAHLKLVVAKDEPSDYDWDVARQESEVVYDSIQAGSDFAEMAQIYSSDGSAANGGDLGFFEKGQMVPEFDSLSFSMKEGEVSKPFKTQFGYHIIKHHGYKTEDGKKKAHVSHILTPARTSQKTLDEIHLKLTSVRDNADEMGFDEAAEAVGLKAVDLQPFEKGQPTAFFGPDPILDEFAFSGKAGDMTGVRYSRNGYYVARIDHISPAGIPAYDEVAAQVKREWQDEKLSQICMAEAEKLVAAMSGGKSLESAATDMGLNYIKSGLIHRNSFVSGVGRDPAVIGAAFSLKTKGAVSPPIKYNAGVAILELLDRSSVDLAEFNAKKDSVAQDLLGRRQQQVYSEWYTNLIDNSEIVNNIERLNEDQTVQGS